MLNYEVLLFRFFSHSFSLFAVESLAHKNFDSYVDTSIYILFLFTVMISHGKLEEITRTSMSYIRMLSQFIFLISVKCSHD